VALSTAQQRRRIHAWHHMKTHDLSNDFLVRNYQGKTPQNTQSCSKLKTKFHQKEPENKKDISEKRPVEFHFNSLVVGTGIVIAPFWVRVIHPSYIWLFLLWNVFTAHINL
jgi:hypothetical protein